VAAFSHLILSIDLSPYLYAKLRERKKSGHHDVRCDNFSKKNLNSNSRMTKEKHIRNVGKTKERKVEELLPSV
jgi:hypothetical protein